MLAFCHELSCSFVPLNFLLTSLWNTNLYPYPVPMLCALGNQFRKWLGFFGFPWLFPSRLFLHHSSLLKREAGCRRWMESHETTWSGLANLIDGNFACLKKKTNKQTNWVPSAKKRLKQGKNTCDIHWIEQENRIQQSICGILSPNWVHLFCLCMIDPLQHRDQDKRMFDASLVLILTVSREMINTMMCLFPSWRIMTLWRSW